MEPGSNGRVENKELEFINSRKMGFDESLGWVPAGEQESLDDSPINGRKEANLRYSSGAPILMHIA
jgi:hypothetical protein